MPRKALPNTQFVTAAVSHSSAHGAQTSSVVPQNAQTSNQPPTPLASQSQQSSTPEPAASTEVTVSPETSHLCMDDMIVLHPSFPGKHYSKSDISPSVIFLDRKWQFS